ncbi:hypothetical protein C4A77_09005 [Brevibacillus laterosporus]|uniref:Uncharacterized protein n=2 Tax=Brevibacillus laterosporus TaxID=1465 RepID=A0AAP8QEK9_BRELA|nr:hypothetical protein C4A77_09005 [Brevibacillus laterosporus]
MGKVRSQRFPHIGTWSPLLLGFMCLFHIVVRRNGKMISLKLVSLAHATTEWFLMIDTDEEAIADVDRLRDFLSKRNVIFTQEKFAGNLGGNVRGERDASV